MRKALLAASALVSVSLLASSAQAAATYITVAPPAGAVTTTAFGINDDNIVAGSYTDSAGVQHGYYGPPDGSNYKTFDLKNVTGTQPRAIFNDGSITGLGLASGFAFGEEFYRSPSGKIKITQNDGVTFDGVVQGGNDSGLYVGDYLDNTGTRVGYYGKAGNYKKAFKLKGDVTSTNPRQVNNNGVVAGSYIDSAGIQHGFYKAGKKVKSFDYPGAVAVTAAEGINDDGLITGLWQDSAGNRHGFLLDSSTGKFKQIGPNDGSTFQEAWGINNKGLVAGDTSNGIAWIYCPLKASKCPKGQAAISVHPRHVQALTKPVNIP